MHTCMNARTHTQLVAGMICAALSFLMAGLLQLYIHESPEECHGDVSIAWQLPQLVLISLAEPLVMVTGLEFSYSQAPRDCRCYSKSCAYKHCQADIMKYVPTLPSPLHPTINTYRNVITAFWFISQALGTLLSAGMAQIPMSLSCEFFIFMVIMLIVTGIFWLVNRNIQYRNNG